ncbi:MAG: leucine-rich repeat protein [Treponema sp.]|nr:leucine-rich repeat protein [Treponema sp.]
MKNSKIIKSLLTILFSITLFSCSNFLEKAQLEENQKNSFIKISLEQTDSSRTVFSQADVTQFTNIILKGTKSGASEQTLGTWETYTQMNAAAIPVEEGNWSFTLTANKDATTFSGTLEQAITTGTNTLSFALSITNAGTGVGSFSITLNYSQAANANLVNYATAALENIDGTSISSASQTLTPSNNSVTYNGSAPAGTYRIKITFHAETDDADYEIASYRELIHISNGLNSTAARTIQSFDALYTVTYNLNNGTLPENVSLLETISKDTVFVLPQLTRDYYTFGGWFTDSNFTTQSQVSKIEKASGNIILYAKFTPEEFSIEYKMSGGTFAGTVKETYTVEDDITLATPTYGQNEFLGWHIEKSCTDDPITGWEAGAFHGPVTLYATWLINSNTRNIANDIENLENGCIIKVSGNLSISYLVSAMNSLYESKPDIMVKLDLSEVTSISNIAENAFMNCKNLYSISLPKTIVSIKQKAFSGCSNLVNITIPDEVTTIETGAFSCCSSLTSLTIPDSVTSIGTGVFEQCSSLQELTIPFVGSSKEATSASESTLFAYFFGKNDFEDSTKITRRISTGTYSYYNVYYYIPNSLKKVTVTGGNLFQDAFMNCSELTSIIIPDGITKIQSSTFCNCKNLTNITIPNSVTTIDQSAFYGCSALTNITIPDNVTTIKNYAFNGCSALSSITFPNKVTTIGNQAFKDCSAISSLTIPDNVTSIGEEAFFGCSGITTAIIGSGVTNINGFSFESNKNLKSVILGNEIKTINSNTFFNCTNLETIVIGNKVNTIATFAFYGCKNLSSITFANTSGWKANDTPVDVTDPQTNATYLKNNYYSIAWTRSDD